MVSGELHYPSVFIHCTYYTSFFMHSAGMSRTFISFKSDRSIRPQFVSRLSTDSSQVKTDSHAGDHGEGRKRNTEDQTRNVSSVTVHLEVISTLISLADLGNAVQSVVSRWDRRLTFPPDNGETGSFWKVRNSGWFTDKTVFNLTVAQASILIQRVPQNV
jgi:hypothetical protein